MQVVFSYELLVNLKNNDNNVGMWRTHGSILILFPFYCAHCSYSNCNIKWPFHTELGMQ